MVELSELEKKVATGLVAGLRQREIARQTFLSESYVYQLSKQLRYKHGSHSTYDLVLKLIANREDRHDRQPERT